MKLTWLRGSGVFLWEMAILGKELNMWGGDTLGTEVWGGPALSP